MYSFSFSFNLNEFDIVVPFECFYIYQQNLSRTNICCKQSGKLNHDEINELIVICWNHCWHFSVINVML